MRMILGGLEDQVEALLQGWWGGSFINLLNAPFGFGFADPWKTNQPVFSFIFTEGVKLFNPIVFSNAFSILSILLAGVVSYKLFRALGFTHLLGIMFALIFSFSPYVFMHLGTHPALLQIWLIPLLLLILIKNSSFFGALLAGSVLALAFLISNYIGFFLMLVVLCFWVSAVFLDWPNTRVKSFLLNRVFYGVIILASFIFFAIPFLLPYVNSVYFDGEGSSTSSMVRTLEDFQNFSARPWYFILPPLANPWFGDSVTKPVLNFLKNDWGYFLADDYFPKEHGGNFLGWVNILILVVATFFAGKELFKIKRNPKLETKGDFFIFENLRLMAILGMTIFLLFLFTFPPFFTVAGHKIYTLGFALYKFFPMFRVTARLSIVILLLVLSVNGLFIQTIISKSRITNRLAIRHRKIIISFFLCGYLFLTLLEFYVPISTFDASKVPSVYEYLSNMQSSVSFDFTGPNGRGGFYEGPLIIAEYPGGRSEDIFWITKHKKGLINPRMYKNEDFEFDAELFTKELTTEEGLVSARNYGVSFVVFHRDRNSKIEDESFFRETLKVEKDFGNIILFRLNN